MATGFPSCSSPTSPTSTARSTRTSATGSSSTARRTSDWRPTRCPGSSGAARWRTSTTTAGRIASSSTGTSTTTGACSVSRSTTRRSRSCSATIDGKRFRLATRDAGPYFETKHVGRGAAFGDIDNDGDIDIVVNHKDAAPAVLRNDTKSDNHWIRFALQGTKSNRDAIGAKLEVTAGERTIYRQRKGGYSMQATNDSRVHGGDRQSPEVKKVVIRWPSGIVQTLENLKVDQEYKVVEPRTGPAQPAATAEKAAK